MVESRLTTLITSTFWLEVASSSISLWYYNYRFHWDKNNSWWFSTSLCTNCHNAFLYVINTDEPRYMLSIICDLNFGILGESIFSNVTDFVICKFVTCRPIFKVSFYRICRETNYVFLKKNLVWINSLWGGCFEKSIFWSFNFKTKILIISLVISSHWKMTQQPFPRTWT